MEVVRGCFVDTSAWFALKFVDDAHHAAAVRVRRRIEEAGQLMYTSDWVLAEAVGLAERRADRVAAREMGKMILKNPAIQVRAVSAEALAQAWDHYAAAGSGPSIVDCASFAVMEELGLTRAFAFDEDFVKAGFQVERAS